MRRSLSGLLRLLNNFDDFLDSFLGTLGLLVACESNAKADAAAENDDDGGGNTGRHGLAGGGGHGNGAELRIKVVTHLADVVLVESAHKLCVEEDASEAGLLSGREALDGH